LRGLYIWLRISFCCSDPEDSNRKARQISTYVQHTWQLNPDCHYQLQTKGFKSSTACNCKLEGCSSLGCHSSAADASSLLGCDAVSLAALSPTFHRTMVPHWTLPSKRHAVNTQKHSTTFQNICILNLEGLGNFSNNKYTENGYAVYLCPQHFGLTS